MMNQEEPYFFMLPSLISNKLVADNSDCYALLTYPRQDISESVRSLMIRILPSLERIDIKTKKRVKFMIEIFAVTLSLSISNFELMLKVRMAYRSWFENSSIFGTPARQNKYLRRLITQLSLPFGLKDPTANVDFNSHVIYFLMGILEDYSYLHREKGKILTDETWITLLNTSIGIADHMIISREALSVFSAENLSTLRQKAIHNVFSIIITSGLYNDDVWSTFTSFCHKWSTCPDFVKVWGSWIDLLFDFLLQRTYDLTADEEYLAIGKFSLKEPISTDKLAFVFHNTLFSLDYGKMTSTPVIMLEVARTIYTAKDNALALSISSSNTILMNKFPALSFMKLFGVFLTSAPDLPDSFDNAIDKTVCTLVSILSKFDVSGIENVIPKIITYISRRVRRLPITRRSFIECSASLFSQIPNVLPYVADLSIEIIQQDIEKYSSTQAYELSLVSLFGSSIETLHFKASQRNDGQLFLKLWSLIKSGSSKLILLPIGHKLGVDMIKLISQEFEMERLSQTLQSTENLYFICGCISYLGMFSHTIQGEMPKSIFSLIPLIISCVMDNKIQSHESYDIIVLMVLQMLYDFVEWGGVIYHDKSCVSSLFDFMDSVKNNIKPADPDDFSFNGNKKRYTSSLISLISNRLNIHMPSNDHFTRKLNSSNNINENAIIQLLGIKNAEIRHFTIGQNILISFIEKPDGTDPLVLFSRGPFGKAVFIVSDDIKGNCPTPKLSQEIAPIPLPSITPIDPPKSEHVSQSDDAPTLEFASLKSEDERLRKVYGPDYSKWLDWKKFAYYPDFNATHTYQRPRVIDFLVMTGLLDTKNSFEIRYQKDQKEVKRVIDCFDTFEASRLFFVPIIHILSADETLDYQKSYHSRTSLLLQDFLRDIAEPMEVNDSAAAFHGLPPLRTVLPMLPVISSFAAFLAPSMAKDADGAEKIAKLRNDSLIKIIFNETNFELRPQFEKSDKSITLIIKPTLKGLYYVTLAQKPNDIQIPFHTNQTLTASSIALQIALTLQLIMFGLSEKVLNNNIEKREETISQLCKSPIIPELGAIAPCLLCENSK